SACGASSASSSPSTAASSGGITATKHATIAATVPAAISSKGTLTVAADASYAPNEFFDTDGTTVIGMDADLAKALAQVMGLTANVVNVGFDSIIPGLASGKYDLGMSSFTDTKVREQTVDFVTYFSAGTSFFIKVGSGVTVNTLADLCGLKVGVEKATTQLTDATAQSAKCTASGKAAVDVQAFPDQNSANLALSSGRVQVGMADSPVVDYQVKQSNGQFQVSGQPYGTAPYGIAIPKTTGMTQPVLAAMKNLIASGVYLNIMTKWGVQEGAITTPVVNGAVS
ncbi:MAG: ABC transporter substrate-binding protein, partial [Candidatus Nanopelagicales bacterium]